MIGPEGGQIGIIPVKEALERARALDLDLVEIAPDSRPPVCRIMDYGKYKYELAKKDKQARKNAHTFQLKEMRYRPKIDEHDYQFKTKHVREFLESGSKVRTFVIFRGREMTRIEYGRKVLERLQEDLSDIANIDMPPKMEGRSMSMVVSPNAEVLKKLKEHSAEKQEENKREDREEAKEPAETKSSGDE